MKFTIILLIVSIALASAAKPLPTASMKIAQKTKDSTFNKVLTVRGGAIISKENFVKAYAVSMGLFGIQFLATPKMFWEMNFADAFTKELGFLMPMMGIAFLGQTYMMINGCTDMAYPIAAATTFLLAYFGPYTAKKTFKTKPAHILPEVLLPTLCAAAIASYDF